MKETKNNGVWASLHIAISALKAFSAIKGQYLPALNTIHSLLDVYYISYQTICNELISHNQNEERTNEYNSEIHNNALFELSKTSTELEIIKLPIEFLNNLDIPPGTADFILSIVDQG